VVVRIFGSWQQTFQLLEPPRVPFFRALPLNITRGSVLGRTPMGAWPQTAKPASMFQNPALITAACLSSIIIINQAVLRRAIISAKFHVTIKVK